MCQEIAYSKVSVLQVYCGTVEYDSPSDEEYSRKTKGLHEDDLF